jgi:DNA-directed RNA polymerase subunit RPC12/RpoP
MSARRYRPISQLDISFFAFPFNQFVGLGMAGLHFLGRMTAGTRIFYCSAPYVSPFGYRACLHEIRVKDDDASIQYVCERCGQYYDWLGILTKYIKVCPDCGRWIEMDDATNFCGRHGEKRVPMEHREVRISQKCTD